MGLENLLIIEPINSFDRHWYRELILRYSSKVNGEGEKGT